MVEKKDGGSHMYSLNDFKIHNTINIENGYMEGVMALFLLLVN